MVKKRQIESILYRKKIDRESQREKARLYCQLHNADPLKKCQCVQREECPTQMNC